MGTENLNFICTYTSQALTPLQVQSLLSNDKKAPCSTSQAQVQVQKNAAKYLDRLGISGVRDTRVSSLFSPAFKLLQVSKLYASRQAIKTLIHEGQYGPALAVWKAYTGSSPNSVQQIWTNYLEKLIADCKNDQPITRFYVSYANKQTEQKDLLDHLGEDISIVWGTKSLEKDLENQNNSTLAALEDIAQNQGVLNPKMLEESSGLAGERMRLLYAALHNRVRITNSSNLTTDLPAVLRLLIDIDHIPEMTDEKANEYRTGLLGQQLEENIKEFSQRLKVKEIPGIQKLQVTVTWVEGRGRGQRSATQGNRIRIDLQEDHPEDSLRHELVHILNPQIPKRNARNPLMTYFSEGIAEYFSECKAGTKNKIASKSNYNLSYEDILRFNKKDISKIPSRYHLAKMTIVNIVRNHGEAVLVNALKKMAVIAKYGNSSKEIQEILDTELKAKTGKTWLEWLQKTHGLLVKISKS